MDNIKEFLNICSKTIDSYESGEVLLNEAALKISSAGIGLGLWNNGSKEIKEIIELALDLEVPKKSYEGNMRADWDKLKKKVIEQNNQ